MNSLILHFYIVSKNESIELSLDKRLSFKENFEMFKELPYIYELKDKQILLKNGALTLDRNIKINDFNFRPLTRLYIFWFVKIKVDEDKKNLD